MTKTKTTPRAAVYPYFVVDGMGRVHSGWEYREDAHDAAQEVPGARVWTARTVARRIGPVIF